MQDDTTFDQTWQTMWPEGTDPASIQQLNRGTVAGEAGECTQLRDQLYRFHRSLVLQDLSNMNMSMGQNAG